MVNSTAQKLGRDAKNYNVKSLLAATFFATAGGLPETAELMSGMFAAGTAP